MPIRHQIATPCAVALAALAIAPAAWAAERPTVTSLVPNEGGSAGSVKVIIHGEHFEALASGGVTLGGHGLKLKTAAGAAAKGEFKVLSPTEIEMSTPFHEEGKVPVVVCLVINAETGEKLCSPETLEAANTFTLLPEVIRNDTAEGLGHIPAVGYGQLLLTSPQINTQVECVSLGLGISWNEANRPGGAITGHAEVLVWSAAGHAPKGAHTELSSRCRLVYEGTAENQPTSPVAWASAEPPLHEVIQQGEVCVQPTKQLSECPIPGEERETVSVIRELSREGLSVPWNVQFTERSERPRARIGLPYECKNRAGTERTELSGCPEASEREAGRNPEACTIPASPAAPGCVNIQIVSTAPLNLDLEYQGYVEPLNIYAGPTGLNPSQWEFEGSEKGEPTLHLRETPTTRGSITGTVKILGFGGQEHFGVR